MPPRESDGAAFACHRGPGVVRAWCARPASSCGNFAFAPPRRSGHEWLADRPRSRESGIAPMPDTSSGGDIVGSTFMAGPRVREDVLDCHDRTITDES